MYARDVLNGRFPAGEKAIATDAWWSYHYAAFLGYRFPAGEEEILKDPYVAYVYAINVLHRRWLKAESLLRDDLYSWGRYKKHFSIK